MSHIQPHKKNSRWDFIRKLFAHDRLRQLTCFPHLLLFVLLWVFCSWVYDDVFYMTEQFSFFSFDPVLMEEITSLTLAPMVWSGRFLLLVFKYPLLGGMLSANQLHIYIISQARRHRQTCQKIRFRLLCNSCLCLFLLVRNEWINFYFSNAAYSSSIALLASLY